MNNKEFIDDFGKICDKYSTGGIRYWHPTHYSAKGDEAKLTDTYSIRLLISELNELIREYHYD